MPPAVIVHDLGVSAEAGQLHGAGPARVLCAVYVDGGDGDAHLRRHTREIDAEDVGLVQKGRL